MKNITAKIFNKKLITVVLLPLFCALILALSIRGNPGNPGIGDLNTNYWQSDGPFELSPERGRFALLYSLAQNHSLHFAVDLARFALPDVAYAHGVYASLFAPAVSFIALPGYMAGKYFGIAQVGSFAVIALFAVFNFLLIRSISRFVGADNKSAALGGFIFLFATPAFAYAVTLYQHHISTFLILSSLYLLLKYRGFVSTTIIWGLIALAVTVDYPNFFMLLPVGVAAFLRFFSIQKIAGRLNISLYLLSLLTFLGAVLPLAFFFWFNYASYGNPWQLSGTVASVGKIGPDGLPVARKAIAEFSKNISASSTSNNVALTFFKNRNMTDGLYTLFISPDRGVLYFTPVVLFGFAGFLIALKKGNKYAPLFFAVLSFNIIIYSMWGDPAGGWAFGARYLIPAYAMLSIFIALLLTYWKKQKFLTFLFFIVLCYSLAVNTLGALTTNANPPRSEAEALALENHMEVPYTYQRNYNYLQYYGSKSYFYNAFAARYLSAWNYYLIMVILLNSLALVILYAPVRRTE